MSDVTMLLSSPAQIITNLPQRADLTMGGLPAVRLLSFTP